MVQRTGGLLSSFRDGPTDQTSDAQLRIGESRASGFALARAPQSRAGFKTHHRTPALRSSTVRQPCYQRPPHPVPNVRDDRETPLCVGRDGGDIELIWVVGEAEYFYKRG